MKKSSGHYYSSRNILLANQKHLFHHQILCARISYQTLREAREDRIHPACDCGVRLLRLYVPPITLHQPLPKLTPHTCLHALIVLTYCSYTFNHLYSILPSTNTDGMTVMTSFNLLGSRVNHSTAFTSVYSLDRGGTNMHFHMACAHYTYI